MIHRITPTTLVGVGGTIQISGGDLKIQNLPTLLLPHHHHKIPKLSEHTVNPVGAIKSDIEIKKEAIFELGDKLNQLTTHVLKTKGNGKLPVQPDHANVSVITLRSGKILNKNDYIFLSQNDPNLERVDSNAKEEKKVQTNFSFSNASSYYNNDSRNIIANPLPPFPSRLSQPRKEFKNNEELLVVFKKVKVNTPLATIQIISRYVKLLKELCTHKMRCRSQEKVMENRIELKVLPSHLKYVFLGEKNTYLVIISKELTKEQEARLPKILRRHKQAIG
ncbi:reverse transcriptase [Cucumis melo var. makuwa]|uniref:Reverse transcriptase n=1 Tax=Cucumis melo var. makuwa TaxID=1194695 RepID=A0A5A7V3Y7_CUCMM|nr:reverse transcriptase [Cucumis melo var. makuwa]